MALTTALAFQPTSPYAGVQGIHVTSTTKQHPLGTVVRAADPIYGEGAFIYGLGVASTARRRGIRVAAAGLVLLAVVGASAGGAAGISGKRAAFEKDPSTYGGCGGYNSSPALPVRPPVTAEV